MALHSSFSVENYWIGPPKGTMSIYGGVIQKNAGQLGTASSITGLRLSGYGQDWRYDTRLSSLAPPFYPTTDNYQTVMWQEN
jgi:hypothetical protein